MLQQKPTDSEPTVADAVPVVPAAVDAMQVIDDLLASPEFQNYDNFDATSPLFEDSGSSSSVSPLFDDNGSFDSFLTSPIEVPYDDFSASPLEDSPYTDYLQTPLLPPADGDMLTGPLIEDMGYGDDNSLSLFGNASAFPTFEVSTKPKLPPTPEMFSFSPSSSSIDSIDPNTTVFPSKSKKATAAPPNAEVVEATAAPPTRVRKSKATGTRKNLKPESLIPMDAPTQKREYALPSATSRKAVPAVFAQKKRLHSAAFTNDDDNEELPPLSPSATEKEAIEHKRRQNTLAARKSRKRKLEHQQMLEGEVSSLNADRDRWQARALKAQADLRAHGLPCEWDDE